MAKDNSLKAEFVFWYEGKKYKYKFSYFTSNHDNGVEILLSDASEREGYWIDTEFESVTRPDGLITWKLCYIPDLVKKSEEDLADLEFLCIEFKVKTRRGRVSYGEDPIYYIETLEPKSISDCFYNHKGDDYFYGGKIGTWDKLSKKPEAKTKKTPKKQKELQEKEIDFLDVLKTIKIKRSSDIPEKNLIYFVEKVGSQWIAKTGKSAIKKDGVLTTLFQYDKNNKQKDTIESFSFTPEKIYSNGVHYYAVVSDAWMYYFVKNLTR